MDYEDEEEKARRGRSIPSEAFGNATQQAEKWLKNMMREAEKRAGNVSQAERFGAAEAALMAEHTARYRVQAKYFEEQHAKSLDALSQAVLAAHRLSIAVVKAHERGRSTVHFVDGSSRVVDTSAETIAQRQGYPFSKEDQLAVNPLAGVRVEERLQKTVLSWGIERERKELAVGRHAAQVEISLGRHRSQTSKGVAGGQDESGRKVEREMPADISRRQDQAQKTSAAQDLQREHGIAVPSLSTGVVHDKQRELASKRAQMRVEMAQSTQDEEITHNPILRRGGGLGR